MNYAYLLAGGASAFALVIHVMLGRARRPPGLRAPDGTDPALLVDAVFGRHAITAVMGVMTLAFAHASRPPVNDPLALAMTAMALLLAGMRLVLAMLARTPKLDYGEWALLTLAGALGALGLNL